jgi:hypothetical protein
MGREEMDAVVAGVATKSEKIRLLFRAGLPKADIARYLDIRYQHVYNVLKKEPAFTQEKSGKVDAGAAQIFQVKIEAGLKVSLPREFAEAESLKTGSVVICRRDADGLKIMSAAAAEDYLRTVLRQRIPDQAQLLDALLAARGPLIRN